MKGSWQWCPECGKMTWIPDCDKTGICFNCSAFVLNDDWEGWDQDKSEKTENSGCAGAARFFLVCAAAVPAAVIGLISRL